MRRSPTAVSLLLALVLAGCSATPGSSVSGQPETSTQPPARPSAQPSAPDDPEAAATPRPRSPERLPATTDPVSREPSPTASDGKPRRAVLSIPALDLRDLPVVPYRGSPDDGPGTRIQDGGVAASPHGARGGVGPGGVGNYIVTAHRTSSTRAFETLPALRVGARVLVTAGGTRYTYRVTTTRRTSFRSARSLARQSAPVPGRPRRVPTRAMITLSTCATPEDHARGNYWSDEFGNPEHRIDKIGVLVSASPVEG